MTYRDERAAWSILDAVDQGADYDEVEKIWAGKGHQAQNAKGENFKNNFRRPSKRIYEVSNPGATKRVRRAGMAGAAIGGVGAGVPTLGAGALPGAVVGSAVGSQVQWKKERSQGNLQRMTGAEVKTQRREERQARRDKRRRDREGKFA